MREQTGATSSESDHASGDLSDDLIWEVTGIAKAINRSPRQTHYMLEKGALPAKKIGGRWCSRQSALREAFKICA